MLIRLSQEHANSDIVEVPGHHTYDTIGVRRW